MNEVSEFAFVDPSVIMGEGNIICEGVIIRKGTTIGNNNYFGPYCIVGELPEKRGWFDKPNGVEIGNNNRFTKQVTIDAGTERRTVIGNNVLMLKNSHVGHDAVVYSDVVISCNAMVGGWCEVGSGSNLGLGSAVHQRVHIPNDTMLGMNSTITKSTELRPNCKYVGSPAKNIGINKIIGEHGDSFGCVA